MEQPRVNLTESYEYLLCGDCRYNIAEERAYQEKDKQEHRNSISESRNQNIGLPFYELNWPTIR